MAGTRELFVLDTEEDPLEKAALMEGAEWEVHRPPPGSRRCVGLWVQMVMYPVAEDWVRRLGPLFQCDESTKGNSLHFID